MAVAVSGAVARAHVVRVLLQGQLKTSHLNLSRVIVD